MDDGRDAISQRGRANDGRPVHGVTRDELRSRSIMSPAGPGRIGVPAQGTDLPSLAHEPGSDGTANAARSAKNEGGPVGRPVAYMCGNSLNHE
ncbi:hypothetical protein EME01_48060 [Sinorhizobium meliloti]|nr:hypothetical protein EME01_48060 [Sinorhizobium meliloti]